MYYDVAEFGGGGGMSRDGKIRHIISVVDSTTALT
jgi:hypothetical protein